MPTKSPIVEALDIGFGYVKHTRHLPDGSVEYCAFPSCTPHSSGLDTSGFDFGAKRDTVRVVVNDVAYEVGPDAGDLDSGDLSRSLNDNYVNTDQYMALFLGALAYMDRQEIDILVVGLPMSSYSKHAETLKKVLQKQHTISEGRTVTVKSVIVVPQPYGGLRYCLSLPEYQHCAHEMNLLIDPGYVTFDYVLANGAKLVEPRCGAHPTGGVSKVLRGIAEYISTKLNMKYENIAAIDRALAERKMKVRGKDIDLDDAIRSTKSILESSVNHMRNAVGDGSDIDNIFLIGGPSQVFNKTVERYFERDVVVLPDARYANVRGFYLIGQETAKRQ